MRLPDVYIYIYRGSECQQQINTARILRCLTQKGEVITLFYDLCVTAKASVGGVRKSRVAGLAFSVPLTLSDGTLNDLTQGNIITLAAKQARTARNHKALMHRPAAINK